MSQENVEAFNRSVAAWNRGDFDAWIDTLDPEFEWFAMLEVFRGHAGAEEAWQGFKSDLRLTARFDEVRDLGDSVLALGTLEGEGRTTHLNIAAEIAQLATFRGGRIVRFRDYGSHVEALEAAGLRE